MAYEVCGFVFKDGSVCKGLYDPNNIPPLPCIFPEDEADKCINEINELELQPV